MKNPRFKPTQKRNPHFRNSSQMLGLAEFGAGIIVFEAGISTFADLI